MSVIGIGAAIMKLHTARRGSEANYGAKLSKQQLRSGLAGLS
ncbi:MAG: hypothetical protein AAFW82_03385 [Pseudomonadota bacterium]